MDRRALILSATAAAAAPTAVAAGAPSGAAGPEHLNMVGVGLPVISGGRVRNYVFVVMRLAVGRGHTAQDLRAKEPYLRDALVRLAHRTPFAVGDDWTQISPRLLTAALMRVAPTVAGRGAFVSAEVVSQSARRRTGVRGGR